MFPVRSRHHPGIPEVPRAPSSRSRVEETQSGGRPSSGILNWLGESKSARTPPYIDARWTPRGPTKTVLLRAIREQTRTTGKFSRAVSSLRIMLDEIPTEEVLAHRYIASDQARVARPPDRALGDRRRGCLRAATSRNPYTSSLRFIVRRGWQRPVAVDTAMGEIATSPGEVTAAETPWIRRRHARSCTGYPDGRR